jgi:hypothetical protein
MTTRCLSWREFKTGDSRAEWCRVPIRDGVRRRSLRKSRKRNSRKKKRKKTRR